jgi:alpha-1,2-mannosyltransferase
LKLTCQVEADQCDYLVALQAPSQTYTKLEPDWVSDPAWDVEICLPFLDGASSAWWSRLVDLPFVGGLQVGREWGKYCLLKRKGGPYA